MTAEPDAGPNDEERSQPHVPIRESLARSSSSVSFAFGVSNMSTTEKKAASYREWISPLRITLLGINAVCFGGCVVLLVVGTASGPLVLLTIATGLSFGAGLAGAVMASRKRAPHEGT